MDNKLLSEEILRQLSLIRFDKSKTLLEQITDEPILSKSEKEKELKKINKSSKNWLCQGLQPFTYKGLGGKRSIVETLKNPCFKTQYMDKQPTEKKSKVLFDILVDNINEYAGNNDAILWALKSIDNSKTYYSLLKRIRSLGSYNDFLLPDLKDLKKQGKLSLKYEYILDWVQLNGYTGANFYYQERQKRYLKYFVNTLEKWGEDPKNMWTRFDAVTTSKPMTDEEVGEYIEKYGSTPSLMQILDPTPKSIVETAHFVLPMASLALNLFGGPPGMIVGSVLELIDASIYLSYDEDPYMFGLGVIFALVPLGSLRKVPGFAEMTEKGVESAFIKLGTKIRNGEKLTAAERVFLKNLVKNPTVIKNAALKLVGDGLVMLAKKQSPTTYLRFISWLYEKGYLLSRGYLSMVNLILATQTFDYYAYKTWGKCSGTFQMIPTITDLVSMLFKEQGKIENWNPNTIKEKIKKHIDFAQPFTKSETECLLLAQYNFTKMMKKIKLKEYNIYKITIDELIKQNTTFSKGGHYDLGLARIQNYLYNCWKSNKFFIDEEKIAYSFLNKKLVFTNAKKIKKITIVTSTGKIIESIINNNHSSQITSKTINEKGVILFIAELENGKSFKNKIINGLSGSFNLQFGKSYEDPKLNFGYFNDGFITLLKSYQEYKKIPINGILDFKTLNVIKNDIYSKTCGDSIKNFTGLELTKEEEEKLVKNDWANLVLKFKETSEKPQPTNPKELTPENVKKLNEIIKKYMEVSDPINDTTEIVDELNFNLSH
jgi:hypothetical protein